MSASSRAEEAQEQPAEGGATADAAVSPHAPGPPGSPDPFDPETRAKEYAAGTNEAWVAALLAARRDEILSRWMEAARHQPFHAGRPAGAVADHIPHLFDGLVALLRRRAEGDTDEPAPLEDPFVLEQARGHAEQRFEQGLAAAEIATEFRLLRQEIGRALRVYLDGQVRHLRPGASLEDLIGAELVVHDALDAAAFLALTAFDEREADRRRLAAQVVALGDEKDRTLAQLEEERRRLRAVLDHMPAGVAIAEAPSGRLVLHNAEAVRVLRHPMIVEEGTTGYYARHGALHPDGSPYGADEYPMARAVRGEVVRDHEMRYRRGDGTETYLSVSAAPIHDAQGGITAAVSAFYDVGERKRTEAERTALLGAVTHDLKNPLTAFSGVVQMLQRQAAAGQLSPERLNERLAVLAAAVTRMRTQLEELAQTVEWSEGVASSALVPRPTDLVTLARGVAAGRQLGTESHEVRVDASGTAGEELVAEVDPGRLERVLDNLLANAIKYSPRGGAITLAVREEGGWATIAISDEGIGIPPADLPRVFERFRRGSNVGRLPGTGIGLAAARQIVEAHGGAITAASEEGKGSTFTIRLPLAADA